MFKGMISEAMRENGEWGGSLENIKNLNLFFCLCHPQAPHEWPQKIQPIRSSHLAGYREHIYIYECLVLLYRFKGTVNVISSYSPFIV